MLFAPQQRVFVVGARNNRLQRFSRILTQPDSKVVVVAGGGPYPGNALWDATQVNANYAYRTLLIRGFDKQLINYLSPDTALDLDQNGLADDVDAVPTSESLREAITGSFTADAQNLLLYLVDHGGEDTFRLTEGETVGAQDLGSWLDQYQAAHPGSKVTVIYDACQSGSMMDELRSSIYDRVVITSATGSQNAYFVSQGTLSFSSFFWSQVFNGASVGEAFVAAAQNTTASFPNQTPQIDADGDGVNNTTADTDAVAGLFVGVGEIDDGDLPVIGGVSAPQAATGSTATISASGVTDDDGIGRVWAVMRPPAFSTGSPDNPVQDLPGFDLQRVPGTDTFQTEFEGFTDPGTYQIAIHARDRLGNAAVPLLTSVLVDNPLRRRAIVVSGGVPDDARYSSLARNADAAISALTQQGYGADGVSCSDSSCDDVYVLTNAGSAGVDAASTLANLEFALTTWGVDQVQDLTLYLVAENAAGQLRLNETESLDSTTLKGWLDTAEANIAGVVTVVLEADSGGEFVRALAPDSGQSRYLVSSTDTGETAAFLLQGRVSFSAFFWSQVFNGDNLRGAFRQAQTAIRFRTGAQSAQLDDNGNGISNEILDGVNARQYAIGAGVQLAGDAPFVGTAVVSDQLTSSFETIAAEQVTSTSAVEEVIAVVTRPDATIVTQPLPSAGGIYQDRSYGLCGPAGDYDVAVYAIDEDGNVSLPATPDDGPINRPADCSDFQFASGFE
ncbi:MAG: C13 family peptidase [Pseudomonadota bacterium]